MGRPRTPPPPQPQPQPHFRKRKQEQMGEDGPNKLTICGDFCASFVREPEEHRSYSDQLEKLVLDFRLTNDRQIYLPSDLPRLCSLKRLEVQVLAEAGFSLLYFTKLIEASPQLREFRIEMFHSMYPMTWDHHNVYVGALSLAPPRVQVPSKAGKYVCRNLKVVEVGGYIGCLSDEELVKALIKIGRPSLESVVIDTESGYYEDPDVKSFIDDRERFLKDSCFCLETGQSACRCLETGTRRKSVPDVWYRRSRAGSSPLLMSHEHDMISTVIFVRLILNLEHIYLEWM